ncbi:MAG: hypothetical protein K8U57_35785 [Planctomycetes bacterium]|nr:hypothetical protein [Planctomycetota bacterium]
MTGEEAENDNQGPAPGEQLLLKLLTKSAIIESQIKDGLPRMLAEMGLRPSAVDAVVEFLQPSVNLLHDMDRETTSYARAQDATDTRMVEVFEGMQETLHDYAADFEAIAQTPEQMQKVDDFRTFLDEVAAIWDEERLPMAEEIRGMDTNLTTIEPPANDNGLDDFAELTPEAWKAALKEHRAELEAVERIKQGLPVKEEMARMKGKDDLEPEI